MAKKVQTPSRPRTAATEEASREPQKPRKAPAAPAKPAATTRPAAAAEPAPAAAPASRPAPSPPAAAPAPRPAPAGASPGNEPLAGAVDSLRRLLSELIEQRLEAVARDLAEVRRTLAGGGDLAAGLEQLDDLLDRLGAVRFTAEPLDVVDPLIHTVVAERPGNGAPRGVVLEVVRPGFRTSRGLVLAKAAVAVSAG